MGVEWFTRTGGLMRTVPAATAVLVAAALAGSGTAAAAAHRDNTDTTRASLAAAGTISTVAGGVGGPGLATRVALRPGGLAFAGGQLYIADSGAIRKVSPVTDRLTTPVGTGVGGPLRNGGPAARASVNPRDVAVDAAGNLVITNAFKQLIRVVAASTGTFYGHQMQAGHIYTVAGNGAFGFSGDGGPATSAKLAEPDGIAADAAGNLVFADTLNNRLRVVAAHTGTFYGQAMTAGDIYTIAGGSKRLGDGGPATSAKLFRPAGIAVDAAGNVLIADTCCSAGPAGNRIRVVAAHTGTFYGHAMTAGDIYTIAGTGTKGFSGNGGPGTAARLHNPVGVGMDAAGNVLVADTGNHRIRVIAGSTGTFYGQAMTAGHIYTIIGTGRKRPPIGDGGPATSATLVEPIAVAVDAAGDVLIADGGRVRIVAASTGTLYRQPMITGDIYTIAGNGQGFSGDGGPATHAQIGLDPSSGIAVDAAGNLVISDSFNSQIRVVAASSGTFYGRNMTAHDIYTVAGTGTPGSRGDGGPAVMARLRIPSGVAVDAAGNLLIADERNERVRVVAEKTGTFYGQAMTAGDIYTAAGNGSAGLSGDGGPATSAELNRPVGVAADAAGNLVIADENNRVVRVVAGSTGTFYGQAMTAGDIYTVAGGGTGGDGGPATSAQLNVPTAVGVDAAGNLLIADYYDEQIRLVAVSTGTFYGQAMTAGDIYTVAGKGGNGLGGFSGDGGPATKAMLNGPVGVTVDAEGNLLIADSFNNRIRVVAERNGTFYGRPMTIGNIYTVAGNGGGGATGGFSGDGGPAVKAELSLPSEAVVNAAGNLLIADTNNARIRKVTG